MYGINYQLIMYMLVNRIERLKWDTGPVRMNRYMESESVNMPTVQ